MKSIFVLFVIFFASAFANSEYWANRMNGMDNSNEMNGQQQQYDQNGMRMNNNQRMNMQQQQYDSNGYRMYGMNENGMMMMPTSTSTPLRGKRGSGYYSQQQQPNRDQMPMQMPMMQYNPNMPMSQQQQQFDDGQMYTMPYYNNNQQQQNQQMGMNRNPM